MSKKEGDEGVEGGTVRTDTLIVPQQQSVSTPEKMIAMLASRMIPKSPKTTQMLTRINVGKAEDTSFSKQIVLASFLEGKKKVPELITDFVENRMRLRISADGKGRAEIITISQALMNTQTMMSQSFFDQLKKRVGI